MSELLPCPFCGGGDLISRPSVPLCDVGFVKCAKCLAQGSIKSWNTRTDTIPTWSTDMDAAPDDVPILLFGRWSWEDMYGEDDDPAYACVGEWRDEGWWSVTDNPYSDKCTPTKWMHLP